MVSAAADARRAHPRTADCCLQVDGGCVADDDAAREVCRQLQQLLLGSNGAAAAPPPKQHGHRALAGGCCSGCSASPCLLACRCAVPGLLHTITASVGPPLCGGAQTRTTTTCAQESVGGMSARAGPLARMPLSVHGRHKHALLRPQPLPPSARRGTCVQPWQAQACSATDTDTAEARLSLHSQAGLCPWRI